MTCLFVNIEIILVLTNAMHSYIVLENPVLIIRHVDCSVLDIASYEAVDAARGMITVPGSELLWPEGKEEEQGAVVLLLI